MEFNATFLVAFFSFIVFTVIMNLILYKPINDIVMKRKQLVDANYEEAHENSDKAVSILLDKEKQIKKATNDAREIISEKTSDATAKKEEMTLDAKNEAQKNIDAYNLYYKNATKDAKEFLKVEVVNLAQAISDKFLNPEEKISNDITDEDIETIMQG